MSYAALMAKPEAASGFRAGGPSRGPSDGLHVGAAHDSFEREADHVADTVASGGRVPGWSLSKMSEGQVRRAPVPAEQAKSKDSGLSMEDAFLRTALGRKLSGSLPRGAHPEAAEEHALSLRGTVVVGPEAAAAVAGLAAAKGGLPARIPEIALDRVLPGLRVHITYVGSAERPTQGRVAFILGPEQTRKPEGAAHPEHAPHPKPAPVKTLAHKEPAHAPHPMAHAVAHHEPAKPHPEHAAAHREAPSKREEVAVQRKVDCSAPFVADRSTLEPVLNSPGRPLDPDTRSYMETRIGHDFGEVRIHADSRAAESAREMGAQAYTAGTHVVFGAGKFSPGTTEGRRLIAHELTHVVQQDKAPARAHPAIRRAPAQIQRAPDEDGAPPPEGDSPGYIARKLNSLAMDIPGFRLFTVILGRNPITDAPVERNANNVTQGVMALVPGGEDAFARLKESGSLDRAFSWLRAEIDQLGFSIPYFKELASKAIDSLSWRDFASPARALARVVGFFRPPYEKIKKFALDALDKVLELIVEGVLSGLGGLGILDILKKAGATFKKIVKDPVGFLGNLLKALGQGFNQFKDRILEHLKNGLAQWLFGQIAATGLTLPKRFDLQGIMNLILQVLGLTYPRIRKRLVNMIGETPVKIVEAGVDIIIAMQKDGPGAAWKLILEKAGNLVDTMLDAVKNWVVTKVVTAAVVQLVAMFNPVGAVLKAIQVIYQTVTFFMEKAKELAEVGRAVVNSVAEIADGNLTRAANFVEQGMAKTIPPMLDFLARLVGLDGIGKTIRNIIEKIQARVDAAIGKVLDFIVGKAKDLLGKAKEGVVQAVGWWKERRAVKIGEEEHSVYMDGSEDAPKVMIASDAKPWSDLIKPPYPKDKEALYNATKGLAEQLGKPITAAKATDKMTVEESRTANVEARRKLFNEFAMNVAKLGFNDGPPGVPVSNIKYGAPGKLGEGTQMTASILTSKHPPGSGVDDDPKIWSDLGSLIKSKHYVQGHLLNHKLGGEGKRFNLSPINRTANANHLNQVEKHVKRWVDTEKWAASYEVTPVYGGQAPTKELTRLSNLKRPTRDDRDRLAECKAELRLPTRFDYKAAILFYEKGWTDKPKEKAHKDIAAAENSPLKSFVDTKIQD